MSLPIRIDGTLLTKPWSRDEAVWLDIGSGRVYDYWRDGFTVLHGYQIPGFMRELDEYAETWQCDNAHHYPQGYGITGYMESDVLRRICCNSSIAWALQRLINESVGVHLNLTNWRSTQRSWHQDGYLNPDFVQDHYIAAWIAVDDIHEDSGPFEFIPGSHRIWEPIRQSAMLELQGEDGSDPDWPYRSENWLEPYFDKQIKEMGLQVEKFIARKGDILVWHPRLLHRGGQPKDPNRERRAIIAHYSGIFHRPDMPRAVQYDDTEGSAHAGFYFPIGA